MRCPRHDGKDAGAGRPASSDRGARRCCAAGERARGSARAPAPAHRCRSRPPASAPSAARACRPAENQTPSCICRPAPRLELLAAGAASRRSGSCGRMRCISMPAGEPSSCRSLLERSRAGRPRESPGTYRRAERDSDCATDIPGPPHRRRPRRCRPRRTPPSARNAAPMRPAHVREHAVGPRLRCRPASGATRRRRAAARPGSAARAWERGRNADMSVVKGVSAGSPDRRRPDQQPEQKAARPLQLMGRSGVTAISDRSPSRFLAPRSRRPGSQRRTMRIRVDLVADTAGRAGSMPGASRTGCHVEE